VKLVVGDKIQMGVVTQYVAVWETVPSHSILCAKYTPSCTYEENRACSPHRSCVWPPLMTRVCASCKMAWFNVLIQTVAIHTPQTEAEWRNADFAVIPLWTTNRTGRGTQHNFISTTSEDKRICVAYWLWLSLPSTSPPRHVSGLSPRPCCGCLKRPAGW
jgi:hypothetical protein